MHLQNIRSVKQCFMDANKKQPRITSMQYVKYTTHCVPMFQLTKMLMSSTDVSMYLMITLINLKAVIICSKLFSDVIIFFFHISEEGEVGVGGGSRNFVTFNTFKMELFMTIVNIWRPFNVVLKSYILDMSRFLSLPLGYVTMLQC